MTRSLRDYNFFLLGCVIVLTGFSLAMVYSARLNDPDTRGYFSRHLVNLIVGAVATLCKPGPRRSTWVQSCCWQRYSCSVRSCRARKAG